MFPKGTVLRSVLKFPKGPVSVKKRVLDQMELCQMGSQGLTGSIITRPLRFPEGIVGGANYPPGVRPDHSPRSKPVD